MWESSRKWVVLVSGIVPLLTIIGTMVFHSDQTAVYSLTIALFAYQLGLIIKLAFETNSLVSKRRKPRRVTKIQLNDSFWNEGARYKRLYMYVLDGERFVEMMDTKNISAEDVMLVVPSTRAIQTYYAEDTIVNDKDRAIDLIEHSIANVEATLRVFQQENRIKRFEIRRLGVFPLDFYALLDAHLCLVGKYVQDPLRVGTIGLKSLGWLEDDPQLVGHHARHFEEIWEALRP